MHSIKGRVQLVLSFTQQVIRTKQTLGKLVFTPKKSLHFNNEHRIRQEKGNGKGRIKINTIYNTNTPQPASIPNARCSL